MLQLINMTHKRTSSLAFLHECLILIPTPPIWTNLQLFTKSDRGSRLTSGPNVLKPESIIECWAVTELRGTTLTCPWPLGWEREREGETREREREKETRERERDQRPERERDQRPERDRPERERETRDQRDFVDFWKTLYFTFSQLLHSFLKIKCFKKLGC